MEHGKIEAQPEIGGIQWWEMSAVTSVNSHSSGSDSPQGIESRKTLVNKKLDSNNSLQRVFCVCVLV